MEHRSIQRNTSVKSTWPEPLQILQPPPASVTSASLIGQSEIGASVTGNVVLAVAVHPAHTAHSLLFRFPSLSNLNVGNVSPFQVSIRSKIPGEFRSSYLVLLTALTGEEAEVVIVICQSSRNIAISYPFTLTGKEDCFDIRSLPLAEKDWYMAADSTLEIMTDNRLFGPNFGLHSCIQRAERDSDSP